MAPNLIEISQKLPKFINFAAILNKTIGFWSNFLEKNLTKSRNWISRKWAKTWLFQEFYLVKNWSAVKTWLNRGTWLFEGWLNRELTVPRTDFFRFKCTNDKIWHWSMADGKKFRRHFRLKKIFFIFMLVTQFKV